MMMKTTSERKFTYQLYLLNTVCKENEIKQGEVVQQHIDIEPYMNREQLIEKELVKKKVKEVLL